MAQRTAHISDYPQQVSLGSVTLCVPVTLSQQMYFFTVLHTTHSQFWAMKTLFLGTETHLCHYFDYFELEKHSYKINSGMSCYPLRMYFFSEYLQQDVGRMLSSGQTINHPSASMGIRKGPNSV